MEFELIQYYLRNKFYYSAQIAASSALDSNKGSVYKLYYGVSLILQKNMSKGLSILDSLTNNDLLGLASVLSMIFAHKQFEFPDINAIKNLELATEDYNLAEDVLFHAAYVCILCENLEEAKLYVDRILSDFPSSVHGFLVKGWLELKNNNLKSSRSCFRAVLSQNNDAVDAYLGEVATVESDDAIYMLNQIIVKLPNFLPPLIEKLNMCMRIQDWPQVLETIDRIIVIQPNCSVALMTQIMHSIVVNGKYDEIPDRFFEIVENSEPCAHIFIQWSSTLVRICCQHCGIVNECIRATQIATNMDPSVSNKLELAYQTLLSGQHSEAIRLYNELSNDDESRPKAIEGIILCQIAMNEMSTQVEEKISLLNEIGGELKSNELIFMNALCTSDVNLKTNLIKLAIDKLFNSVENLPYGLEYLTKLNPAMILFFLKYISDNSYKETTLDKLLKMCPGLIDCWIMLASVQNTSKAYQSLEKVLEMDSTNIDAHLMIANLMIREGDFSNAAKSLDSGLSYNLSIGELPLYHMLNGLIHEHYKRHEECIRAFENALKHLTNEPTLSARDLTTLYISLIQSYCISEKIDNANTTLQSAYNSLILKGTEYEKDLKLAEANIALYKNNTSSALAILNGISPDQHTYIKAQEIKADIYLKSNLDPVEYAECYKKLVDSHPTIQNMINMADAYLKIQEPDEAVKVIKNALTLKNNPSVCLKVAKVLVAAHRYTEAINYYNKSGKDGAIELANLLIKLNQCDMAIKVLGPLPLEVKVMPMSYALEKKGNLEETLDMLKQCSYLENQNTTTRLNILRRSGEIAQKLGKHDLAIGLYKQALVPVEVDSDEANEIKIKLANLYMEVNDWTSCEIICSSLLKDKNNDLALLIIADLSFRRCDFITAKKHFCKLLEKHPTNWAALARLVEVGRRMDSLEELKTTMTVTYKHNNQAGFHYCFGLYCWYTAIINDAMEHFNLAKNDVEWGQQSLHNMVLICLDEATLNLSLASKLIEDMKPNTPEEQNNLKLLSTFILLLSKDKQSVEKAMNLFTEMSQESYKIAATLGMAIAFVYQKQVQRARNVLKRVAKSTWQFEEADYLERSWLLLAELYFQSGKTDISVELIKKVLVYNKSSVKGLTLMSAIAEKEQKYDDAVSHYKRAWALCGQKDFKIGYKLAVVLYKNKQYTKSVELCFDLNTTNPEQIKLKKEIFDKARHCLRSR
ncbi:tetratricopeptide repeat protein 21B-like [Adelges cooleyi]|uniref:tetratricopeptide repeat protein 21B-like n=1 Tax=Adelges cooleyi TaxID=133065 RepID=UPI0021801236|nr:tetratricopeptide repeat protein 21B-like [Adelges cooleyi]XP_050420833.1 tetratricopeptide repeat protein 21B-like [Adelges cooleyi]XP_050420834.1 tetratricopeptide repeat protein 21B-like [Adelges cooleyi]XP_050420835.1 tetratricopeptide repeat protein 21B-like [Adelges cooleyi]XP_050420836.1 tetratricopeptide repeat protein 21B-like [Adelges cooleyi]